MPSVRLADATLRGSPARAAFHAVPDALYATEPPGTAPVQASVERNLAREELATAQRVLVALDGEVPVGRVCARLSPVLRDEVGAPIGMLGFFESRNDAAIARVLFEDATAWLRARGAGRIVGPMDGDTWHRYRVNVGPFQRPPFPLEPWNPAWYQALWERNGFATLEVYTSKWIDDVAVLLPALERGKSRSEDRGVRVRQLRRDTLREELTLVHELSSRIFADAFLYSPISRDEFLALYAGIERFLEPELVLFAESSDGESVGFVFGYEDPTQPAVHYKTIGVLPDWRGPGVAAALSHHVYSAALRRGRPQGSHPLMRSDNRSQALDQGHGDVFRRYVLYEWTGA